MEPEDKVQHLHFSPSEMQLLWAIGSDTVWSDGESPSGEAFDKLVAEGLVAVRDGQPRLTELGVAALEAKLRESKKRTAMFHLTNP